MSEEITNAPPSSISREQIKKILKADLVNMMKKVANGKTLSSTERQILTGMSDKAEPGQTPVVLRAKNQTELAAFLGFKDRKTIQRWMKDEGNPGRSDNGHYVIADWKAFAKSKGHTFAEDEERADNQTKAKAKNILLQNAKLEFQIGILKKEFIPTKDVEQWGAALGGEIRKSVVSIHKIASSVAGLTPAEIEIRLKELEDEILMKLHLLAQRVEDMKEASLED